MKTKILKSVVLIAVIVIASAAAALAEMDMQGNYITNLAAPTKLDHAVPKGYADYMLDVSSVKLPKPGNQADERGRLWPNPRFNDNGDGTVTDYLTDLMWTKNGNPRGSSCNWNTAIDYCEAYDYADHDDWRLPNINELSSLVNYSQANISTWLNSSATPFSAVQAYFCWSSSSYAYASGGAWRVHMYYGYVSYGDKTYSYYVWPVRAGR